jgi:hypothetical protein
MYGSGLTDAEGRYSNAFTPFYNGWFYVSHEGYTSANTTQTLGEPGVGYPEETVTLYRTGGVEGTLVDASESLLANAQIRISLEAEGLSYHTRRSGFYRPGPAERLTDANGFFAMDDELPAVLGDVHIDVLLENRGWREAAVVPGVEVSAGQVVDLGNVIVSLE